MRHIQKGAPPALLTDWIAAQQQQSPVVNLDYGSFPETGRLKRILIDEQFGLCGYTGQALVATNSHIEHLKPQEQCKKEIEERGGIVGRDLGDDLNYFNLIAARNSGGKNLYGAEAKKSWWDPDDFVSPLQKDCASHFDFTIDGAIYGADRPGQTTIKELKLDHPLLNDARRGALSAFLPDEFLEDRAYLEDLIAKMEPELGSAKLLPEFAFVIRAVAENILSAVADSA